MAELYFLGVLFVLHLVFVYFIAAKTVTALEDSRDAMTKLAQLGWVSNKAKTSLEAVEAQVGLERELAVLGHAEEALEKEIEAGKGRPTGFKDASGRIIKFMTAPDQNLLARIPKDRLIYN